MTAKFNILSIVILTGRGADKIGFNTDLPTPFPAMKYDAGLQLDTAAGYAEEYCRLVFPGVPVEVITMPKVGSSFSEDR